MRISRRALVICLTASCSLTAQAQSARRDAIADLLQGKGVQIKIRALDGSISKTTQTAEAVQPMTPEAAEAAVPADPRTGEIDYEQAKRLMSAVDAVLKDAAETRSGSEKLPSRDDYIIPPLWGETREKRNDKVRNLLDAALGIVTDVPVVDVQKKVEALRKNIRDIEEQNGALKEKQLIAPKDATLPGILTDTVASLENAIAENNKRIEKNRAEISAAKGEITTALKAQGVELQAEQVDLLLDSVISGDLVLAVTGTRRLALNAAPSGVFS